jgi:acetyl-CoA carboxylase beta subunit
MARCWKCKELKKIKATILITVLQDDGTLEQRKEKEICKECLDIFESTREK